MVFDLKTINVVRCGSNVLTNEGWGGGKSRGVCWFSRIPVRMMERPTHQGENSYSLGSPLAGTCLRREGILSAEQPGEALPLKGVLLPNGTVPPPGIEGVIRAITRDFVNY